MRRGSSRSSTPAAARWVALGEQRNRRDDRRRCRRGIEADRGRHGLRRRILPTLSEQVRTLSKWWTGPVRAGADRRGSVTLELPPDRARAHCRLAIPGSHGPRTDGTRGVATQTPRSRRRSRPSRAPDKFERVPYSTSSPNAADTPVGTGSVAGRDQSGARDDTRDTSRGQRTQGEGGGERRDVRAVLAGRPGPQRSGGRVGLEIEMRPRDGETEEDTGTEKIDRKGARTEYSNAAGRVHIRPMRGRGLTQSSSPMNWARSW